MIRIVIKNGRYCPFIVCDVCQERIKVAGDGIECQGAEITKDDHSTNVFHVHKGYCDHELQKKIGKQGWNELSHHLFDLCTNAGLGPEDFQRHVEIRKEFDF